MDTALIKNNKIVQVWANTPIESLSLPPEVEGELAEFEPGVIVPGMVWDGTIVFNPPAPVPTTEDVNAERNRRQTIAIPVQINANSSFYVDVDDKSRTFILAVTEMANIITAGGGTDLIDFTGADNITRALTPDEIRSMSVQVFQELARIQAKSRQIKDMDPIPSDYTDNQYWN